MSKFRYWKLTYGDVEKLTYDSSKILNWEIKCIREPEDEAKFIGVFLYRNGTPHDYESKKGIVYYHNNIDRNELPAITKFLKNKFNGNIVEKSETPLMVGALLGAGGYLASGEDENFWNAAAFGTGAITVGKSVGSIVSRNFTVSVFLT